MVSKKDIYIRIQNIDEISLILKEIKSEGEILKKMFKEYDRLNFEENKIFETWGSYLEEIDQRLDHITL